MPGLRRGLKNSKRGSFCDWELFSFDVIVQGRVRSLLLLLLRLSLLSFFFILYFVIVFFHYKYIIYMVSSIFYKQKLIHYYFFQSKISHMTMCINLNQKYSWRQYLSHFQWMPVKIFVYMRIKKVNITKKRIEIFVSIKGAVAEGRIVLVLRLRGHTRFAHLWMKGKKPGRKWNIFFFLFYILSWSILHIYIYPVIISDGSTIWKNIK